MRSLVIHAPLDLRIESSAVADPGAGQVKVKLGAGGICGSDLHYFRNGGFGTVRLKEPMILGHEVAGTVVAIGPGVTRVQVGERIAINPNMACGRCRYCVEGHPNQCLDVRYYGSAMRFPHVQGAFREEMIIDESQAYRVAPGTSAAEAAFAEPFSVALHAVSQAGPLLAKRVLVTGCGPIGCLAIVAARLAGAGEIVATDISAQALATAARVGADRVLDVSADPQALQAFTADKGYFDVTIECSGNPRGLLDGIAVTRPKGTLVMVGLGGEVALPAMLVVTKEITLRGAFRAAHEFGWAVDLISNRRVNLSPLLTASFPIEQAAQAFELAGDRSRAMKVQFSFGDSATLPA
jgi:L-idonate 5-dehydrogenase